MKYALFSEDTKMEYKNLKVNYEKITVKPSDVDDRIAMLREQNKKTLVITDRPSRSGDEIVLDYAGFCDGVQFQGGTAKNQTLLLGSGMFIPGFEEQLIGKNAGEDVDVNVTFPEQYPAAHLAGKAAVFHCKLHEIHELKEYKDDEEFAKDIADCESVEQLRELIKNDLQAYYDAQSDLEMEERLADQICESFDYIPTEEETRASMEQELQSLESQLMQRGLTLEAYCGFTGKTKDELREEMRPEAIRNFKIHKALEEIAKLEGIEADAQSIADEVSEICRQSGVTMEEFLPHYDAEFAATVEKSVILQKTLEKIKEYSEITVVNV
ncbi:MAG: trigger factor [Clostridia bacterium]|nr:trigger factor [Clostridia bacterium]